MASQIKTEHVHTYQPRLEFSFSLAANSSAVGLQKGKLILVNSNKQIAYSATSGLSGFQHLEASKLKGRGRIPTCKQAQLENYYVATTPIFMPNVKGVNGNFYPITPFKVWIDGYSRSDLGIHLDTNVPGSAGCLVIVLPEHWRLFEQQMKNFASKNIVKLPLYVS